MLVLHLLRANVFHFIEVLALAAAISKLFYVTSQ